MHKFVHNFEFLAIASVTNENLTAPKSYASGPATTSNLSQKAERVLSKLDVNSTGQHVSEDALSDGEVQDAIIVGTDDKNRSGDDIGLTLEDSGQKFSNAMAAINSNHSIDHGEHSGFAARMFIPRAWVAWKTHEAKRKFHQQSIV